MKLIPVKYHNKNYPEPIIPQLKEVAGNFDSSLIEMQTPYSLHTEYSYMARKFDSEVIDKYQLYELKNAHKGNIPELWKSEKWADEFATFIETLIGDSIPPEVIEIHPPFRSYCSNFETFWSRYLIFYNRIIQKFPKVCIVIENRCGTMYTGSPFLLSTCNDMIQFAQYISSKENELKLIIDYPQLFSAEKIKMDNVKLDKILSFNSRIKPYISAVKAIHMWGKKKSRNGNRWTAHNGDLNTFFSCDDEKKYQYLSSIMELFNDDIERYFVPEVNSAEDDLVSIINDFINSGAEFVQNRCLDYLIDIAWDNGYPEYVLGNSKIRKIRKIDAIGQYSIFIGSQKHCVGNCDIQNKEHLGCPNAQIIDKGIKCEDCERNDPLKYCVRCTGKKCFVRNKEVLSRCNQEHFVYLAYFAPDIVKVGVAHSKRKYTRLYEQGAILAYFIASCPNGKSARELESAIRNIGFKDKVFSTHKIKNLMKFDTNAAKSILNNAYRMIISSQQSNTELLKMFFDKPEIFYRDQIAEYLMQYGNNKSISISEQLAMWDDFELFEDCNTTKDIVILDRMPDKEYQFLDFAGTIAIFMDAECIYLYDFKNLLGRELQIKNAITHTLD